jgi:hypothetical protein
MLGSYLNPHAIQPGEKLTPQLLFERYLDWNDYKEHVAKAWKKGESCDEKLYSSYLCCDNHFRLQQEYGIFFHYFFHLDMVEFGENGFSIDSLVRMIDRFSLRIDEVNRDRLRKYWGINADLGFKHLDK